MKKFRFNVLTKDERGMMRSDKVQVIETDMERAMHLANAIVMGMLGASYIYLRTRLI